MRGKINEEGYRTGSEDTLDFAVGAVDVVVGPVPAQERVHRPLVDHLQGVGGGDALT